MKFTVIHKYLMYELKSFSDDNAIVTESCQTCQVVIQPRNVQFDQTGTEKEGAGPRCGDR